MEISESNNSNIIVRTIRGILSSTQEPKTGTLELGSGLVLILVFFRNDILPWFQIAHERYVLLLMLLIFLLSTTYVLLFYKKYRFLIKLTPYQRFYWDKQNNPYCPNCKTLLTVSDDGSKFHLKCPNKHCLNPKMPITNIDGDLITLKEAIRLRTIKTNLN